VYFGGRLKNIVIINYPKALKSAVYGLAEMFELANKLASDQGLVKLNIVISEVDQLPTGDIYLIVLPPSIDSTFNKAPTTELIEWLESCHQQGSILCSVCSGVFLLAATGIIANRVVTTHWGLEEPFKRLYPSIRLDIDKILINDSDIITAGGLMSWLDLGLEIVARHFNTPLMRVLGKQLVVDTGFREQRYYHCFMPNLTHGDNIILKLQRKLQESYSKATNIATMASFCNLTERTFLRRFVKATSFKPTEYLQRLRVQKACDMLETTTQTFETITYSVGYDNVSAFRKTFVKIIGLTPTIFRKRFVKT